MNLGCGTPREADRAGSGELQLPVAGVGGTAQCGPAGQPAWNVEIVRSGAALRVFCDADTHWRIVPVRFRRNEGSRGRRDPDGA